MKKTYEVIHAHNRVLFPTYEDALEFAKESIKPVYDKDNFVWDTEYNKALIITEDERVINGINVKMIFVNLLEFMYDDTWSITDMKI